MTNSFGDIHFEDGHVEVHHISNLTETKDGTLIGLIKHDDTLHVPVYFIRSENRWSTERPTPTDKLFAENMFRLFETTELQEAYAHYMQAIVKLTDAIDDSISVSIVKLITKELTRRNKRDS